MAEDSNEIVIDGVVSVPKDVDDDQFLKLFIDWVELQGFTFGGATGLYEEPKKISELWKNESALKEIKAFLFEKPDNVSIGTFDKGILFNDDSTGEEITLYNTGAMWTSQGIGINVFKLVRKLNSLGYDAEWL